MLKFSVLEHSFSETGSQIAKSPTEIKYFKDVCASVSVSVCMYLRAGAPDSLHPLELDDSGQLHTCSKC